MRALALCALSAAVSTGAFAQDEEGGDIVVDEAGGGDENFGGDDTPTPPPPKGAKKTDDGGGETTAPETYIVRPGDTLWNLSQRFLNNPWYWPRIWSYNQSLDNPNWIYPGGQIRFYPGNEITPPPKQDEADQEPDFEDIEGGGFEGDGVGDRFNDVGNDRRRRDFFVPNEQLQDAGQVLNSPEEKRFLAVGDRIYVKLKKQNKPGDVLQVFRPGRDVRHPVTGANLGRMVEMVGELRVDLLSREQALGTIMQSWDTLERGDYVAELPVQGEPVKAQENQKNVKAYVVETGKTELRFFGEQNTILVDKGSSDGVQLGNMFIVVRAGDPYTKEYSGLADEDIGEVLIIETQKNNSTGLIINATRELVPGDRAEMRLPR